MRWRRGTTSDAVAARSVLRREVDFVSRYAIEATRGQGWRECRIIDISRGGAGMLVPGVTEAEMDGRRLIVELEIAPALLRVRGQVRHVRSTDEGVQIGVQFDPLNALERDLLDSVLDRARIS